MKKTKQVDTYYCDYCGKECEHTPLYVVPKLEPVTEWAVNAEGVKVIPFELRKEIVSKHVDICPNCQRKVALLLQTTPRVSFDDDNPLTMSITFSNQSPFV